MLWLSKDIWIRFYLRSCHRDFQKLLETKVLEDNNNRDSELICFASLWKTWVFEKSKAKLWSMFTNTGIKDNCCHGWNFSPKYLIAAQLGDMWWLTTAWDVQVLVSNVSTYICPLKAIDIYIKMHTGRLTDMGDMKQEPRRTDSTLKAPPETRHLLALVQGLNTKSCLIFIHHLNFPF